MTKALPPHTPPHNVRPINASIAIIQRPDAASDAMYEQLRAKNAWIMTTCALQRRIDQLETAKKLRMKELSNELKVAHDDLGQYLTGKPFEQVAGAIQAVVDALKAGDQPLPEDIREIMAHVPGSRERWIARDKAESFKASESKRMQAKIDEVAFALAKYLRYGPEGKVEPESPQADLPGVERKETRARAWAEPKVQRTVYDTVAEEVKTAAATVKTATAAGDLKAAADAEKARAAAADLQQQLLDSGFVVEPEEDEGDDGSEEQGELTLEDDINPEGDDDGIPPDAIDIGDAQPVQAQPMDPADHPALKGHMAAAADKRAKAKDKKLSPPSNHP